MPNPQQLDIVKPTEIEDTITSLMTKGFLGGAPVPVGDIGVDAGVLEHSASGAAGSVDGLSSHALSHGATIISGPSEGGALLDRPLGSFLMDQAGDQSLSIEQYASESGPTYLAKRIAGAGEMEIGGVNLNLIDFVPGGDFVQMAAGEKFNPSSMLLALAKTKMESEAIHGHLLRRETDQERAVREADRSTMPVIEDGAGRSVDGSPAHEDPSRRLSPDDASREVSPWGDKESDDPTTTDDHTASRHGPGTNGRSKNEIDNDTAARDMAILSGEHARNLDTAVSQWDENDVHTEMTLHGRKIEIDTHFDAHNPDNQKERETAEDHAKHIPTAENKETVTEGSKMAFRSQVHAHLEAMSRDEGITL